MDNMKLKHRAEAAQREFASVVASYGLTVNVNGCGTYSYFHGEPAWIAVKTEPVPVKGNAALIAALKSEGYQVNRYKGTDGHYKFYVIEDVTLPEEAPAADPEPAAEEAAADPELHYFDVAVEVAPGVYSCNLAVAETADDVSAHYAQTRPGCDVTITEVDDGEYAHDEARRRGKPVVICPHIIDAPAAEALATPTEAPAGNHSRTAPHDLAPIDRAAGLVLLDHLDALRRGNKMQSAEEALRFACAYVAEAIGVPSRSDWTGLLLQNPNTLYAEEFPVDSYRTRTGLDTPEYNRACAAGGYRERDILQRCTCWGNRDPRTVGGRNIREFWYVDADGRTVSADYDLDRHIWTN